MLRKVSNMIRKDGPNRGLRWNEKHLKHAIDRWNAVYVGENQPLQDLDATSIEGQPSGSVADGAMTGGGNKVAKKLNGDGISFNVPRGRKLSEPVKQALKRIHCNLGHPSKADLERFLKLGGVTGESLEALNWMECVTCAHGLKPKTHRNAVYPHLKWSLVTKCSWICSKFMTLVPKDTGFCQSLIGLHLFMWSGMLLIMPPKRCMMLLMKVGFTGPDPQAC